jgi:SPP1 family predicted phage head-tail adaptor
LQGSQIVLADALRNEVTHRITIRYRAGITPRNRVSYGGRTMEILAVIDKEEAHIYQQLLCREMV